MAQKVIGGGQSHMTIQHARDVGRYRSDFQVYSSHFINIQINFQQKNLRILILSLQDRTKRLCDFCPNFKLLSKPVQIIFQLPQCYPGYQWKFYYETCHTDFLVSIQSAFPQSYQATNLQFCSVLVFHRKLWFGI